MIIGFWTLFTSSVASGLVSGASAIIAVVMTLNHQNKKTYPEKIVQLNILINNLIFLLNFLEVYLQGSKPNKNSNVMPFSSDEIIIINLHNWISFAILVDRETYELAWRLVDECSSFKDLQTLDTLLEAEQYNPENEDNNLQLEAKILSAVSATTLKRIKERREFYIRKLKRSIF